MTDVRIFSRVSLCDMVGRGRHDNLISLALDETYPSTAKHAYQAGRKLREQFELAEIGSVHAIDPSKEAVELDY